MILTLIAILCLILASLITIALLEKGTVAEFIAPICLAIGCLWLVGYAIGFYRYIEAGYKVGIINEEYGTHYTQEQMFYAEDVIEVVRELKRERLEVNGNLLKCPK